MKKEALKFGLAGALIIFVACTIADAAGFSARFGQDEQILFFLQVASGLGAIASALGLVLT
jgi:hypothetical protein